MPQAPRHFPVSRRVLRQGSAVSAVSAVSVVLRSPFVQCTPAAVQDATPTSGRRPVGVIVEFDQSVAQFPNIMPGEEFTEYQ